MLPTILVTGGAGYIGSHASKALFEAGWLPVAYDDLEHVRLTRDFLRDPESFLKHL
jgi:UDP-glucose 4-epimerase